MEKKEKVLISACLLGVHCRYDGKCQEIPEFQEKLPDLMEQYELIPVCPEIYGGLSTPRDPAEQRGNLVVDCQGNDVTEQFQKGAEETLYLAKLYGCQKAILKRRSPSCGSEKIYDGTFSKRLIAGDGVTAKLIKAHGIVVFGEDDVISGNC